MKNLSLVLFGFILIANSCGSKKTVTIAPEKIPQHKGFINDFEDVYSDAEEKTLDSLITAFEKETSVEIALVTLDTVMVGLGDEEMFNLTFEIANSWAVGKKEKNNGILIGISKGRRLLRIQNGLGIEKVMSNRQTKEIVDNYFIPYFKEDHYFTGTYEGLKQIMSFLRKHYKQ